MATTDFTTGTTITKEWLNDVDEKLYQGIIATGTTERRTLEDRAGEIVTVKDFGAVGDGITADDTAFANAIVYLDSVGGGELYVPPGIYRFTATLTVNKPSIVIRGAGAGAYLPYNPSARSDAATRFIFENTGTAVHFTPVENAPPLVRSGITDVFIDCDYTATVGLRLTSTRHGIFKNLTIFNAISDQILTDCYAGKLQNGNGYDVQHNHFENISTFVRQSAVTFSDSGDTVNFTSAHGLSADHTVYFTAIVSTTGISTHTVYYVVNPTANNFQLAASAGGAALPLTTNGTGTIILNTTCNSMRLTGGQGNAGTGQGNTSFNYFSNIHLAGPSMQDCLVLEDTDNNQFHSLRANGGNGSTTYSVVFGSGDQDSGPLGSYARHNQFFGLQAANGIIARASQTGGTSSLANTVFGWSRSDGATGLVWESGAGGADDGDMFVIDTYRNIYSAEDILFKAYGRLDFTETSNQVTGSRSVTWTKLGLYEEGNLNSVSIEGGTTAGSGSYSVATGFYTRIGRTVHVTMLITWTGHTGTGDLIINGLPFTTINNNRLQGMTVMASNLTFSGQIAAYPILNTQQMKIVQTTSGSAISILQMDTNGTLWINGMYTVE